MDDYWNNYVSVYGGVSLIQMVQPIETETTLMLQLIRKKSICLSEVLVRRPSFSFLLDNKKMHTSTLNLFAFHLLLRSDPTHSIAFTDLNI